MSHLAEELRESNIDNPGNDGFDAATLLDACYESSEVEEENEPMTGMENNFQTSEREAYEERATHEEENEEEGTTPPRRILSILELVAERRRKLSALQDKIVKDVEDDDEEQAEGEINDDKDAINCPTPLNSMSPGQYRLWKKNQPRKKRCLGPNPPFTDTYLRDLKSQSPE